MERQRSGLLWELHCMSLSLEEGTVNTENILCNPFRHYNTIGHSIPLKLKHVVAA